MKVGWQIRALVACCASLQTVPAAGASPPQVVINEIHFDPSDKRPLEFVELHNPTADSVALDGWSLEKFAFPSNTTIPARGFAVVAQDPDAFSREFSFRPLGPLPGRLRNAGEKLTLRNRNGELVDEVAYRAGFPWPTAALGAGPSLERIHPRWTSGELTAMKTEFQLPPNLCQPGGTYRVRARYKDHTGRQSHWSEAVQVQIGK